MGSSLSCEKAFPKFALGACFTPSGHAFVTAVPKGLDWCGAVKMRDDVVVIFSIVAFTHNELLAGHLVSFERAPTTQGVGSVESSLVSSIGRILYWFVNSNTGGQLVMEVVKTALSFI